MEDLIEGRRDCTLGGVHALIQGLHHQIVAVTVHHQRGQQVRFSVHDAVGIGIADHGAPVRLGGAQAVQKEIAADLFDLPRQHTQTNLRTGTVVRRAQRTAPQVGDLHRTARLGAIAIGDIAAEDPGMAAGHPVGAFAAHADFIHRASCKRAIRSSVEGWVENRRMKLCPVNGLMMNMCAVEGEASIGMRLRPGLEFLQSADQRVRRADILGAGRIGVVLPRTRNRHLNQHRRDRRQNHHGDRRHRASAILVIAAAAEPERHAGQERNGPGDHRGHRTDQDVAMQYVAQFVRDHALQFVVGHQPQNAGGEGQRRVLRIASRGKRVGRIVGDDPQLRHGQPHALAEIAYHRPHPPIRLRVLGLRHRLRRVTHQRDLVGVEVTDKIHDRRDGQGDVKALASGDGLTADQ